MTWELTDAEILRKAGDIMLGLGKTARFPKSYQSIGWRLKAEADLLEPEYEDDDVEIEE